MTTTVTPALAEDTAADLSLQEAARLYGVSAATLGRKARWGVVTAYKARGPWGWEWRVSRRSLEASGYRPRPADGAGPAGEADPPRDPQVTELQRQIATLRRVVARERLRADRADRELGQAMLECGRLRRALARAEAGATGAATDASDADPVVVWV